MSPLSSILEPQMGIEPTSSEWQSDVLAIVLLRRACIIIA